LRTGLHAGSNGSSFVYLFHTRERLALLCLEDVLKDYNMLEDGDEGEEK
jgi:hypothetical protein